MRKFYQSVRLRVFSTIARRAAIAGVVAVAAIGLARPASAPAGQAVIGLDPSFYAQGPRLKAENGMVILWAPTAKGSPDSQIQVFDSEGRETMSLNLLESLPEAKNVVISDVSVSPGGTVAVGAQVFTKKDRGKSKLLLLDSAGHLYNSIAFDTGLGVVKLEVDDDQNIWVLRLGAGMGDPAKIPVLAKYDRDGNLTDEFLHFSDFTKDAQIVHGGLALGGDVCMGVTQARVWFWMPSSRELVTVFRDGSGLQRVSTGLPAWPGASPAGGTVRARSCGGTVRARSCGGMDPDGMVCQVSFVPKASDGRKATTALYQFRSDTRDWQPMQPASLAEHPGLFLGVDQGKAVFASFEPENHSIAVDSVTLGQ